MRYKFLFREENVGEYAWNKRTQIANKYYEVEQNPFVQKGQQISQADFQIMLDTLIDKNVEV